MNHNYALDCLHILRRGNELKYNLTSLGPAAVVSLKKSLTNEAGVNDFTEKLKSFLSGKGKSSAEKDSAFSLGAELNSNGIIDMIPIEELRKALNAVDSDKVDFFIKGLPKRHRDGLEVLRVSDSTPEKPVVVKAVAVRQRRGALRDPIGDMLTRIRNAQMRGKTTVNTPASRLRKSVLDALQDEGYIRGYTVNDGEHGTSITIDLKYSGDSPVIREVKHVVKPRPSNYPRVEGVTAVPEGSGVTVVRMVDGVSIVRTDEGRFVESYDVVSIQ